MSSAPGASSATAGKVDSPDSQSENAEINQGQVDESKNDKSAEKNSSVVIEATSTKKKKKKGGKKNKSKATGFEGTSIIHETAEAMLIRMPC